MTGFCGWYNQRQNNTDSEQTIREMWGAPSNEAQDPVILDQLALIGASSCVTVCHSDGVAMAISGKPVFNGNNNPETYCAELLQHYRSDGHRVLEKLHGVFSLAIVDQKGQKALLAIDRIGVESLAYYHTPDLLLFGSDITALHRYPEHKSSIDPQSIYNYLYFHCIPSPRSIFTDTYKLLPAQYVEFQNGTIKRDFYWQPEYQEPQHANEEELAHELSEHLDESVRQFLYDEASTGVFLSGGLDSSTVTGIFAKLSGSPVDAYGIGFDAKGYDEMEYARASANHFGVKLHEYYVTPGDVADAIPKVAGAYDEPFGNASAVPTYYCAKLAKNDGKERLLAGDGGDELFAGNARYSKQLLFDLYQRVPASLRRYLIEPVFLKILSRGNLTPINKIRSYIEQANIPMPDRLESYNFLHRTPADTIFSDHFISGINTDDPLDCLRDTYGRPSSISFLKRMLYLDLKFTLADNDLRKVNRMCQYAGIKVGYPMLNEELVSFAAQIPSKMLIRRGELRSFYRKALTSFLSPVTLDKNKHGFGLPFGVWMTEDKGLRELACDSLTEFRKRGILRNDYLDMLLSEQLSTHAGYYGVMVWVIMMLEIWMSEHRV